VERGRGGECAFKRVREKGRVVRERERENGGDDGERESGKKGW